jgi:hypothetical protein
MQNRLTQPPRTRGVHGSATIAKRTTKTKCGRDR